jgi:hypothetical protein
MKQIFLFSIVIMAGCHKEQVAPPPIRYYDFTSESIKWAVLPLRRYFIYKDSSSGQEDSVFVYQSHLFEYYNPPTSPGSFSSGSPAYFSQNYELGLKISGQNSDWFYGSCAGIGWNSGKDSAWISFCGHDNFTDGDICGIGFAFNADPSNYMPFLDINGIRYADVMKTHCTSGGPADTAQTWYFANDYYWAKGIGIIKRTIRTHTGDTYTSTLERFGN